MVKMLGSRIVLAQQREGESGEIGRAKGPSERRPLRGTIGVRDLGLGRGVVDGLPPLMPPTWSPRPIVSRSFQPGAPRRRLVLVKRLPTADERDLATMHKALMIACRVANRHPRPGPSTRTVAEWTGTIANLATDYADDKPTVRPAAPSPAELDLADHAFELVFALKAVDEFAAFVVLARAVGVAWKQIGRQDPKRRSRQFLALVRLSALRWMVAADRERGLGVVARG
jgi:hypothetical protein